MIIDKPPEIVNVILIKAKTKQKSSHSFYSKIFDTSLISSHFNTNFHRKFFWALTSLTWIISL